MSATFTSPEALLDAVGADLGTSDWTTVDQASIDGFAEATGDHQWIHVDPERAASGPFGGTIAHGYLSLSLLAPIMFDLLHVDGTALVINSGSDRVRFITPVRSGSRVRGTATIAGAERVALGVRVKLAASIEIEGETKPALVAETLTVFVPA
jgi:acyl dehydratase